MTGDAGAPITVEGVGRDLGAGGDSAPTRIELRATDLTISRGDATPVVANLRDLSTIAVDHGRLLMVFDGGAARFLVESLGDRLGLVVSELRERRARQMLHDRFIELPVDERLELVEYRAGDEHGVAQIGYQAWGAALLPLDERVAWHLIRRADLASVHADGAHGVVQLTVRPRPGGPAQPAVELLALGDTFERHRAHLAALRDGAFADAAAITARLMPDAPFAARQVAAATLVDGRPAAPAELGDAWQLAERAVLVDPSFAASYATLVERGTVGGVAAPSWLAIAPRIPGQPDENMSWFLVGLPGNLVAFELVSEGAHATYLYRIVPRAEFGGQSPADLLEPLAQTVYDISECLIDTRFLREPIYLPETRLIEPGYTRYRFAIAALPTLRVARSRFVGRLIHADETAWAAALEDAIKFNSTSRDDAEIWPGGAAGDAPDDGAGTQEDS